MNRFSRINRNAWLVLSGLWLILLVSVNVVLWPQTAETRETPYYFVKWPDTCKPHDCFLVSVGTGPSITYSYDVCLPRQAVFPEDNNWQGCMRHPDPVKRRADYNNGTWAPKSWSDSHDRVRRNASTKVENCCKSQILTAP